MKKAVQRKLWLLVAILLVVLSCVAQLFAGGLPSLVRLTCVEGRVYSVGLFSICTSNNSDTVWMPWREDVTCELMQRHKEQVPSWISGTHILSFSAVAASLCCMLLLCCYTAAPPSLSISIADGLAALCFGPAALQTAGMLNLSSGISHPSSLKFLLPDHHTCEGGHARYAFGTPLIIGAIILQVLAGVTCILSKLIEDKATALAEYQQYLNDSIVTDLGSAYKRDGSDGGSVKSDIMQRGPRKNAKEKEAAMRMGGRSTSVSMMSSPQPSTSQM